MGWLFVRRRMSAELGTDWKMKFANFDKQAAAAASLGQVHKAFDGKKNLACKLQYPDMQSAVEADLKQLRLIFSIYQRYDRAINTDEIYSEVSARLREELDYVREAKHMDLYRNILGPVKAVHVPQNLKSLSTPRPERPFFPGPNLGTVIEGGVKHAVSGLDPEPRGGAGVDL